MDELPNYLLNSGALEIRDRLKSISGKKVLDVATQSGDFILTLMKSIKEHNSFIGVDISNEKWDPEKFEKKPVKFIEMNAENLEFDDNTFDLVSISHSLHHLANIDKVLAEMKRVLKSDGYFIIQECFCDGNQTEAQVAEILTHHWDSKIDTLLGISHNKTLTKRQLKDIVDRLSLKEVETFESAHYVKCLFCDDKLECADPKNKSIIDFAIKEINEALDRLAEYVEKHEMHEDPVMKKLREEGERLKEKTRRDGSALASHLFFIGRKE